MLKWPQFEQLPKRMCESLQPALEHLAEGGDVGNMTSEARLGISRVEGWLQSPCFATVKIDGTNVGVDNEGRLVGRNMEIEPGASYQKVDIWSLLAGFGGKAQSLQDKLQEETSQALAQVMLYGELVVNGKYNYDASGVFKSWLCFGVIIRPSDMEEEAIEHVATVLRAVGYNSRVKEGKVLLAPNEKLFAHLQSIGVPTVANRYQPQGAGEEWSHQGALPKFTSVQALLTSNWARQLFLAPDGPLGEGLVIALEGDGSLFKWKNYHEELGKVPDLLREAVTRIQALAHGSAGAKLISAGMLLALESLLLTSTAPVCQNDTQQRKKQQLKESKADDVEAFAAFTSALTKVDCPEDIFARGKAALAALQQSLIDDVTSDLIKDFGVADSAAKKRALAMVRSQIGKSYADWMRSASKGSA